MNSKSKLPGNLFCMFLLAGMFVFNSCEKATPGGGGTGGGGTGGGGGGNPNPSSLAQRIILDTAYGTDAKQKMDIYLPAGRNNTTKVIIMIHGGGWAGGDKSEVSFFQPMFWQKWPEAAIVNINYRLANNSNIHHAEIMADVKNAIKFITDNKTALAISDTLALWGNSAGAQLALLYTYTQNTNNYVKAVCDVYGPCVINDWSWYNSYNIFVGMSVKEVLTRYNGSTWEADSTYYFTNSPYVRVQANSKPTIIFHGTIDVVVPLYQSQWLRGKLNNLGVPNEYYEYFFDGHGFNPTNNYDCVNKTVTFFKKYLK